MTAELRKLMHSRILILLYVFIVLFNGYLFRRECLSGTEYSFYDISKMYKIDNPHALAEIYQERMNELILTGNSMMADDEGYITRNLYSDYHLLGEVLERKNTIAAYPEYLDSLIDETMIRLDSGIFGDEDSFENRNMRKAAAVYERLKGTKTDDTFHGTAELFNSWQISDLFAVMLSVSFAMMIMGEDDRKGMRILLNTLKKGKNDLYKHKASAVLFVVILSAVLIYGPNYIISVLYAGTGNMKASVQSVYGMQAFPYRLSVGQYLCLWFLWKIIVLFAISSLMILISTLFKKTLMAVIAALSVTAVSFTAGLSSSLSATLFSVEELLNLYALTNGYICLNIFSHPVPRWICAAALCMLLSLLSLYFGGQVFINSEIVESELPAGLLRYNVLTHSLFRNEGIKICFFQNGILVLLLLAFFTGGLALSYSYLFSQYEASYHSASLVLDGTKSEEKEQYIREKREEYDDLNERLAELIQSGSESAQMIVQSIEQQLQAQIGFEKAATQYESLPENGVFIYSTGYEELFGREGVRRDLFNMAAGILAVCLIFAGIHSKEYETNVISLMRAYGKENEIQRYKLRYMIVICLMITLIVSLPQYIRTAVTYSLPYLSKSCANLIFLSEVPSFISIGMLVVMIIAMRYLIIILSGFAVNVLSKRIKDSAVVLIFSSLVLAAPFLIVRMLI